MEKIIEILKECLNEALLSLIISDPKKKEDDALFKVKVRPLKKQGILYFQIEEFRGKQVFHSNCTEEETCSRVMEYMQGFRQMQIETKTLSVTVLSSKKGKITVKKKVVSNEHKSVNMEHNRKKKYILQEGMQIPFLQDLKVMTTEGKIVHAKFDKFRQINRFLEFIEDILPQLAKDREVTILDFGCGKSYLTFAMYYYLHEMKGYDVRIIGLDLKADVIRRCNELAKQYGYKKLTFLEGDIADYEGVNQVDMVVTLHACDTATDYALAKAIGWGAKVILSVPCCQHELNGQIANDTLAPVFSYGLIKERMAALVTDAMRAEYLKREGYEAQILEFIDMEHTPKNILIRAVKTGRKQNNQDTITACEKMLHITPTMGRLLDRGV